MKIGLVTPYIYPLPGGVNAHVGFLHQHLRERGHDVRIITSTHGLQRSIGRAEEKRSTSTPFGITLYSPGKYLSMK